jgi:hypothetical protein
MQGNSLPVHARPGGGNQERTHKDDGYPIGDCHRQHVGQGCEEHAEREDNENDGF